MKKLRTAVLIFLCLLMLIPLSACGGSGYRVIDTYSGKGSFVIAFRKGDRLRDYVTAAMGELAAGGTIRALSTAWFGENLTNVKGDEGAMNELWAGMEPRVVNVGIDITNMPMSYPDGAGSYQGFDVDLANYIFGYLGLSMVLYPIDSADLVVELNSGNIDMAMGIPENDMSDDLDFSPAYLTSQYVLVARASSYIHRRAGLKGKTLGVSVMDLDVLSEDDKFVEKLGAITYQTNTDGLFQALRNGEVDGILVSSVAAAYYMK